MDFPGKLHSLIWGVPTLVLILGMGIVLTVSTGFAQFRLLWPAAVELIKKFRKAGGQKESCQAFCTALAATVGTGNIAGVAGAIALGGPGAVFWIWVCGFLGMVIKYAEALLAVRYQGMYPSGERHGGPMEIIRKGLGSKFMPLAVAYALFGIFASFGVGNAAQVNAVTVSLQTALESWGIQAGKGLNWLIGGGIGVLFSSVLLGGAKRVGAAAERLVPAAACMYLLMCIGALCLWSERIPIVFGQILCGALNPKAVTGGMVGSALKCISTGISRGVFTNEAGMGTAAIAHGGAAVSHPVQQGLLGIMEVFIDTIVICTLTALVILCSGIPVPYGMDPGAKLTVDAFAEVYGTWAPGMLSLGILLFAFAAMLGWGLYGGRCVQFLFGENAWKPFVLLHGVAAAVGGVMQVDAVWRLSEIFNGLMILPNMTALILLLAEVRKLTKEYSSSLKARRSSGYYKSSQP